MQAFIDFAAQYWPSIASVLATVVGYFLVFLYKHSTRHLNNLLKNTFKENTSNLTAENKLFEQRIDYALKEARAEYIAAVKLCEDYQKRVEYLEETLKNFLDGGDEDGGTEIFNDKRAIREASED